jgi:hypothetical protein
LSVISADDRHDDHRCAGKPEVRGEPVFLLGPTMWIVVGDADEDAVDGR